MTFRPTRAVVDLDAIRGNIRALKPSDAELMAVVKANAYGHGDVPVARAALEAGATWLGVALVEEGLRLREAGIDAPVLVLAELPGGSEKEALASGLTPTIASERAVHAVAEAAGAVGRGVEVHVKVDTGMGRVGVRPDGAGDLCRLVLDAGLTLDGVWTHLARAEELTDETTRVQLDRFEAVLRTLEGDGIRPRYGHAANSAGTIAWPDARLDLVRVGIAMYGVSPGPQLDVKLAPAMSLRSRVSFVKRVDPGDAISYGHRYRAERATTIATVPIGYADGYPRALSNKAPVLVAGRRCRVAGTITMDQLMVDCGDLEVEVGDEVVLYGTQGEEEIRVEELAELAGTIGYELVAALGERVPREHRGNG